MKKLALTALVAGLALPTSAMAATNMMDSEDNWFEGSTQVRVEVQNGALYNSAPFIPVKGQTMTMDLVKGGQLHLDGEAAYLIDENGNKFLANDAPHTTTSGITYQTEDGIAIYATPATNFYMITADARDTDNDNVADDVNFSIDQVQ